MDPFLAQGATWYDTVAELVLPYGLDYLKAVAWPMAAVCIAGIAARAVVTVSKGLELTAVPVGQHGENCYCIDCQPNLNPAERGHRAMLAYAAGHTDGYDAAHAEHGM